MYRPHTAAPRDSSQPTTMPALKRGIGATLRYSLAAALLAGFGALAACNHSGGSDGPSGAYPNDDRLRLNHIQIMGTHNSYHPSQAVEPMASVVQQQYPGYPGFAGDYRHRPIYEQLDRLGVRHLELDVYADPDGGNFSQHPLAASIGADIETHIAELDQPGIKVFHVPQIDSVSTCYLFKDCLREVKRWSDEHRGHAPLIIMIEIKDIDFFNTATYLPIAPWTGADYDRLDAEIRDIFPPEQLITPDDVRGSHATLEEAVLTDGWPTLADSRGKILFTNCNCLSNDRQRIDYEIGHPNLEGRVLFPHSQPGNPDAAIINLENPVAQGEQIRALMEKGYLVRTRADVNIVEAVKNDVARRDAAFAVGATYVGTDFPEPSPWINAEYFVQVPDGTPVRCNPVTAPNWCDASDVENPEYLATGTQR